jgi:excisionase family DNA binding protein
METLLTAAQVAERIGAGCGVKTVRRAFREKKLAGVKLGRSYAFRESDVEAWLASQRQVATVTGPRVEAQMTPRSAARRSKP